MASEAHEVREENRQERIARLEAELADAKQKWIAHKRTAGGPLRALIEECLPSAAGKVFDRTDGVSSGLMVSVVGIPTISREALVEDIFQMLADNSGRFIRAMNPLL